MLQEVGLLDDGKPLVVTGNSASYSFTETVAKLRGVNSIVGRAVIIHGNGSASGSTVRMAQCVIGRQSETGVPGVRKGGCIAQMCL